MGGDARRCLEVFEVRLVARIVRRDTGLGRARYDVVRLFFWGFGVLLCFLCVMGEV